MDAQTTFTTERAARYLASLCKHFGHKVPVQYDAQTGWIDLPLGRCELNADPSLLRLKVSADSRSDLDTGIRVITSHLERFAFREHPDLDWTMSEDAAKPIGAS